MTLAELTDMEQAVLAHIRRYKVGVEQVMAPQGLWEPSLLAGLVQSGWLLPPCMVNAQACYVELTPAAFWALDGEPGTGRRLSGPAAYKAIAFALFCGQEATPRTRILAGEFRDAFPDLARPGLPCGEYYVRPASQQLILGLLQIAGGRLPVRCVRHAHEQVQRRRVLPAFRAAMEAGGFEITLLTDSTARQQALQAAFKGRPLPVPCQIVVCEELTPFARLGGTPKGDTDESELVGAAA